MYNVSLADINTDSDLDIPECSAGCKDALGFSPPLASVPLVAPRQRISSSELRKLSNLGKD